MVGLLLPPSVPGALVNWAAMLGGKVPVNLNYTVSEQTLAACIQKLFSGGNNPAPPPPVEHPVEVTATLVWIDTAHLQLITHGLPDEQIGDVLDQMLASACAEFDLTFPQVQAACADQNQEAFHRAIHGLKGCFQMLGWLQAAQGCVEALAELRAGTFNRWTNFPDQLRTLYHASQSEMTRYLATHAPLALHTD